MWLLILEALAAGGLYVLGTERHESRRIDNQLRGRSGRQGDPGASRFYLSLDDSLMRIFAGERVKAITKGVNRNSTEAEKAAVASWNWRVEFEGLLAIAETLRNSSPAMANRALPGPVDYAQIPALAQRDELVQVKRDDSRG